jgi:hypothetical protein
MALIAFSGSERKRRFAFMAIIGNNWRLKYFWHFLAFMAFSGVYWHFKCHGIYWLLGSP